MEQKECRRILKILTVHEGTSISKVLKKLEEYRNKVYPRNSFSTRLKNGTVNYDEMADIAKLLGYEIQFVKKDFPNIIIK